MSDPLAIHCPACGAGYLLPANLLGEHGARVRCPGCGHVFSVGRDGAVTGVPTDAPAAAQAGPVSEHRQAAAELLAALDARLPGALLAAAREGRLFAAHGADLLGAYDEFRRRCGAGGASEVFREELRARYGVDLLPVPHEG
jgi:predicted Zn finger-like uncharacterized protein